jgi:hypothetical protein
MLIGPDAVATPHSFLSGTEETLPRILKEIMLYDFFVHQIDQSQFAHGNARWQFRVGNAWCIIHLSISAFRSYPIPRVPRTALPSRRRLQGCAHVRAPTVYGCETLLATSFRSAGRQHGSHRGPIALPVIIDSETDVITVACARLIAVTCLVVSIIYILVLIFL